MLLTALPADILIVILQNVSIQELVVLSQTCRLMSALIMEFGWTDYLHANPRPSSSLSRARMYWSPRTQVRYDVLTDHSWSRQEFIARPLSRPWASKLQPILAISASRLIVAAGSDIYSYKFGESTNIGPPSVLIEATFPLNTHHGRPVDITSITFLEDGGLDQTLCVGYQNGTTQRVFLNLPSDDNPFLNTTRSTLSQLADGDFIESLSSQRNILLSLSSSGLAILRNLEVSDGMSDSTLLNARGWVSHLCLDASGPYAAFGTSSPYPLRVHSIRNDQISQNPTAVLYAHTSSELPSYRPTSSAVYGICRAPLASPWGASPQVLVSGWFDGQVRCYDLRSSSRAMVSAGSSTEPTPLHPVLTLRDPLQLESIYSVSCGGGSSSHIAAGSARHSVVSFWDVRLPTTGWSVHAPGNDRSPVYSIILESSRLYGATQSRPFVYDFGPGVTPDTYPSLPSGRGIDGLKRRKGSIDVGYYVTKYPHTTRTPK